MFPGFVSVLLLLIVYVIYDEVKKWWINAKMCNFESPQHYPILGVANRFFGVSNDQLIGVILQLFDEVKTPSRAWLGPVLIVGVAEPHDIQTVLINDNCLNKPYFYDHLECKTSILISDKDRWKPDRRALNVAFNSQMLRNYTPYLNEKARILLTKLTPFIDIPGDLYRCIFICMMDMITRTTMGIEKHIQFKRGELHYAMAKQVLNSIQYRVPRFWLRWNFIYHVFTKTGRDERILNAYGFAHFHDIYCEKVQELNVLKSKGIDHLKEASQANAMNVLEKCILLEQDGVFNHENVLHQMRAIAIAGSDTSSSTVFGTLLLLAINQQHQELIVDELRSVFETADCDVTESHLAQMKYTERVIKESMRLLPPIPLIARKVTADIELSAGTIPSGTIILINIMHVHRNVNIWGENVLEFDPDRFLPENLAKRPTCSYLPFSYGSRNCIGFKYAMNSVKITLAHLLRRYKFTTDLRFEDVRLKVHIVLEVTNDKPLRIEKRHF